MNRLRLLTVLVALKRSCSRYAGRNGARGSDVSRSTFEETSTIGFHPFSFSFTVPTFVTAGHPHVHPIHRDLWLAFV